MSENLAAQGKKLFEEGNFIEARESLQSHLAKFPEDDETLHLLATTCYRLKLYQEAVENFSTLIGRHPEVHTLYTNIGMAFLKSNQPGKASLAFKQSLKISPNQPSTQRYLAMAETAQRLSKQEEPTEFIVQSKEGEPSSVIDADQIDQEMMDDGIYADGKEEALSEEDALNQLALQALAKEKGEAPPATPSKAKDEKKSKAEPAPSEERKKKAPKPEADEKPPTEAQPSAQRAPDPPPPPPPPPPAPTGVVGLDQLIESLRLSRPEESLEALSERSVQIMLEKDQGCFIRARSVISAGSDVSMELRFKKWKGKKTQVLFGAEEDPFVETTGPGRLVLADKNVVGFRNGDGVLYVVEDSVMAFDDNVRFENGSLKAGARDMSLVQFKGSGWIALRRCKDLISLAVTEESPVKLKPEAVVGWFGKLVPQPKPMGIGGDREIGLLELRGQGTVLLKSPKNPISDD